MLDAAPDLVVLSVGANDAVHSTPLAQFERDLRAVVGALDRAGIETLVCGLIDLALIPRVPTALRTMLRRRGEAYERRKARATHPAARAVHVEVGRRVNEVFRARGEAFFTPDRFHPNGDGHGASPRRSGPHFDAAVARAQSAARSLPHDPVGEPVDREVRGEQRVDDEARLGAHERERDRRAVEARARAACGGSTRG